MEHTTIAVDLAKSVRQVAVSHRAGQVSLERRLPPTRFLSFFAQQPPATVLLEACGSAHHWARQLQQCGHDVRLLPADDVHRSVRRDKTDRGDAKALLEAARNDEIRAVPVIHALTDDDRVSPTLRPVLVTMAEEVRTLEATIHGIDQHLVNNQVTCPPTYQVKVPLLVTQPRRWPRSST